MSFKKSFNKTLFKLNCLLKNFLRRRELAAGTLTQIISGDWYHAVSTPVNRTKKKLLSVCTTCYFNGDEHISCLLFLALGTYLKILCS